MSEQIDIAVDLGVIPPPLPEIEFLREFVADMPDPPPQLIEGILHQGCKMVLGGTSKSNKSWCLLNLALSVASGTEWWGRRCVKMPVAYINFELHRWAIAQRINALAAARPECTGIPGTERRGTEVLAHGHQEPAAPFAGCCAVERRGVEGKPASQRTTIRQGSRLSRCLGTA